MSRSPAINRNLNDLQQMLDEVADRAVVRMVAAASVTGIIPPRKFLTNMEAAARIGCEPETLSKMRSHKQGPPWTGKGQFTRYTVDAVDDWLANMPRAAKDDSDVIRIGFPKEAISCD